MRRELFSLFFIGLTAISLSSCATNQASMLPSPSGVQAVQRGESRSVHLNQSYYGRQSDIMPDVSDANDVLHIGLADGRTLNFPGTARISHVGDRWRVNGPGYQIAMSSGGVTEIRHRTRGKDIPVVGGPTRAGAAGPTGTALMNACAGLDNCCTFNCGGGVGGCDAAHQNCGPCPDCGGPIQSSLQDQLDCYYSPAGSCGNDALGNPFGTLVMKFPGAFGSGGITCLWNISDQAYLDGTDLNCADDEPNILNLPFNGNVTISYTWSRNLGQTTIQCGPASPNAVTQALFSYKEVEGNVKLTGEHVERNILPGTPITVRFKPSLSINSLTNGTYTYRAFAIKIAAFCNGAIATPVL